MAWYLDCKKLIKTKSHHVLYFIKVSDTQFEITGV